MVPSRIIPKILVVDDEENFLTLMAKTLRREGYWVATALDGQQALRLLEEEPFDLASIDIRMAPMNGLTLLDEIKKCYPLTKVIIVTVLASHEIRRQALQKGASTYLVKPVNLNELKDTIRNLLFP